jgi:hypothetical protein
MITLSRRKVSATVKFYEIPNKEFFAVQDDGNEGYSIFYKNDEEYSLGVFGSSKGTGVDFSGENEVLRVNTSFEVLI